MDSVRSPLAPITSNRKRAISPDDLPLKPVKPLNCDAVRRKITAFLNSGEMKVTEFQRTLGINSNSYGRFMKLKGPLSGMDNQTFHAACPFFMEREVNGMKPAKKKKVAKEEEEKVHDVV